MLYYQLSMSRLLADLFPEYSTSTTLSSSSNYNRHSQHRLKSALQALFPRKGEYNTIKLFTYTSFNRSA